MTEWLFQLIKPSELLASLLASSAALIVLSKLSILISDKATEETEYFIDSGIVAVARLFLRGAFFLWAYIFGASINKMLAW